MFKLTMPAYPYLKMFTVFSSFPLIIGNVLRNQEVADILAQVTEDGEQFLKRIYNGESKCYIKSFF